MAQTGVQYPNKVDLVTRGDSCFHLVVVEEEELGQANTLALQEKLNNYLDFALGGGLVKNFPEANGMPVPSSNSATWCRTRTERQWRAHCVKADCLTLCYIRAPAAPAEQVF